MSISGFKPWLESLQAIATIAAIVAGGIWTYRLFVMGREDHAHAVVEERIFHMPLTSDDNVVQVVLKVENAGHKLIDVSDVRVMLEQVLPIEGCADNGPCVAKELNTALDDSNRTNDRFHWPMLASRYAVWSQPRHIEPGESETFDFEFVTLASVKAVRVYGFVKNDEESRRKGPALGWHTAQFYRFDKPMEAAR